MPRPSRFTVGLILCCLGGVAAAETGSLFQPTTFGADRGGLFPTLPKDDAPGLWANRDGRGAFFAEGQGWIVARTGPRLSRSGPAVARLRDLIASAEAGPAGYDAVQHAARIKPPRRPTQMTVAEIYAWIDATPGQHHAIGRYQFIPPTLRRLVRALDVHPDARFSPGLQDQLADLLLQEAGLQAFRNGTMPRSEFKLNLARIWAGLPTQNGKSYYDGYAGNKATMTWADFSVAMQTIFPG